jgi:signal transduction histidine kinase
LIGSVVLFGLLLLARHYDYLLFHVSAETFSSVVGLSIFALAWTTRRNMDNDFLLFLGIAYLFVAFFDILHMLSYSGMGLFQEYGHNLSTQTWLIARYIQAGSLLAAPLFLTRKLNLKLFVALCSSASVLLLFSLFVWHIFPTAYVEGVGLTSFKMVSEYVICGFMFLAVLLFVRKRKELDLRVFRLMVASIALTILSELSFTLYRSPFGMINMIGHFLKIIAFYLIYLAIIQTGIERPQDILFRKLKQYREHLEDLVEERTRDLLDSNIKLSKEMKMRIEKEEALEEMASRLRALAVKQDSVREEERKRIALEVHDKLGQELTVFKLGLRSLSKTLPDGDPIKARLDEMSGSVDETIGSVRKIASDLRPALLDDLGLAAAMEWQLKSFERQSKIVTSLDANLEESCLHPEARIGLFRICQEALTNVARHSGASRVDVELAQAGDEIIMKIKDNGRGIGQDELSKSSTMGILGMKERAHGLGGRCEIKGKEGAGTSVLVKMPIAQMSAS